MMLRHEAEFYVAKECDPHYAALAYAVYAPCDVTVEGALARVARIAAPGLTLGETETLDILNLYAQGYNCTEIGELLGHTKTIVNSRRQRWREKYGKHTTVSESPKRERQGQHVEIGAQKG